MTRVPDDELARLKKEVSLLRLAESSGLTLAKKGADYHGHCPFHEDKTPSLVISPKTNLYHCFGCGAAGSVIDWVMHREGVSFREAVERLTQEVGVARHDPIEPSSLAAAEDPALLTRVVAFYHQTLKNSPEALAYLDKRGLNDPELIDRFQLGYANRSLGQKLPIKAVKAGAEIRTRLQNVGILRESGHEHFNGSLVVPLHSATGEVAEMYGRKIGERLRKGTPLHLYLPGPHRGVFNHQALAASKEIIVCESLIDAMTFWVAGYRHVTSAFGTEGVTDELIAAFIDHGNERVLIAFDRDRAGDAAADKLSKRLMEAGIECFRVQFPKGMDANEYACQMSPPAKALGLVLRKAVWMGKGNALSKSMQEQPAKITDTTPAIPEEPPIASPAPPPPDDEIAAKVDDHDITLAFEGESPHPASGSHQAIHGQTRTYRVRGLNKNIDFGQLKVNVLVSQDEALHVDTLDLYNARQRAGFVRQTSIELGEAEDAIKAEVAKVLLKLEQLRDAGSRKEPETTVPLPNESEKREALDLLQSPDLLDRIVEDVERCGLVGERANVLMGYLAAVSRKLDQPLAILIQSTSAAGKSTLMDTVLELVPEEERVHYSAMTGQSLFYMGEQDLKHKILGIAEEEGVQQAAYALKLLQSQGELTIASTGKDETTGNLVTKEYRVEGPVMLFLTTTAVDIDEELLNRCVVLSVNESREQTRRIHCHQRQARTLAGLIASNERSKIIATHQHAQRLLKPLRVVNPFAEQLTFLDTQTRTRRDHQKYLALIDAIALLHQHQRPLRQVEANGQTIEYIEATLEDITAAHALAHEVLGRSLDELPPQTRRLLHLVCEMVRTSCKAQQIERQAFRFSRRQVREYTGWGNTQLKVHLGRLEDLEYLLVYGGGRGRVIQYELAFDHDVHSQAPHLAGLTDPQILGYDAKKSGHDGEKSGSSRPQVGGLSGTSRPMKNGANHPDINDLATQNVAPARKRTVPEPAIVASQS